MKDTVKKHPFFFSLLLYTVLFVLFYMLAIGNNAYMFTEESDAAYQSIPQAIRLKRFYTDLLSGDFAPMDYNILFGSEQLFSMGMPLNPFNFILVFLSDSGVMYYLKILYTVCMYTAGVGFMVLCRHTGIKPGAAAVSALLYAFSPYVFFRGIIFHFFTPVIAAFPFMITGMERIFQGKSMRMLLISTFVSVLLSGLYMFAYLLILTVIYAFVRVIFMKEGGFFTRLWKYGWRGGLAAIAGVCAAAAAVIPQIMPILSSTRTSQVRTDVIETAFMPSLPALNAVVSVGTADFSLGTAMGLLAVIFVALKSAPGLYKFLLGICALTVYIPVFPAAMCTFSYIEHRWAFAFAMLGAWCSAYVIQNMGRAELSDRIISGAAMVIYLLCFDEMMYSAALPLLVIFLVLVNIPFLRKNIDRFLTYIDSRERYILEVIVYLVLTMFTVILLAVNRRTEVIFAVAAVYTAVTVCFLENRAVKNFCLLVIMPLAVLPVGMKLFYTDILKPEGDINALYDQFIPLEQARDRDMAAGDEIVRFESSDKSGHNNISLSRELAVTSTFINLIPQRFADVLYNAEFDINTHTALNALLGFEHRLPFMAVWGVDYIHTEETEPGEDDLFININSKAVPSVFEKTEEYTYNGLENALYKNRFSLPFGFAYDSSIKESGRQLMNGADYGINLMYSAAVEGKTQVNEAEPVSFSVPFSLSSELITYDEQADITYTRYTLIPETPEAGEVYLTLRGIDVMKHKYGTVTVIINDDMERAVLGEFGGKNTADTFKWFTYQDSYTFCCSVCDEPVEKVEVRASCEFDKIELTVFPLDSFKQQFDKLSEYTMQNTVLGSNEITGSITVPDERILCLQLLYTDGWRAYDNGVPAEIIPVNGCMTGLQLSPGEHDIRLEYHVPGLAPGMAVSGVTIVIIAAAAVITRKKEGGSGGGDI